MGGAREEKLPVTTHKTGQKGAAGAVRFHEADGQVHFHDDVSKVKCVVPVAEYANAWHRFKVSPNEIVHFADPENNTEVEIVRQYDGDPLAPDKVDIRITLTEVKHGSGFEAMNRFMVE